MPTRTFTAKEFFTLLLINFKVKVKNLFDYSQVMLKYYSNPAFRRIDTSLMASYLFDNPFLVCKRFLEKRGEEDVYTYGETPLTTLDQIARSCQLTDSDLVFELGCGRGRTCFWLNRFISCSVVGVDFVPTFIERAQQVKEKYKIDGVEFRCEDLLMTDLTGATVVYLYGICYSDIFIKQLISRLESLPEGAKVITISYGLTEYKPDAPFEILKCFPAKFTWGIAQVYLQIKIA